MTLPGFTPDCFNPNAWLPLGFKFQHRALVFSVYGQTAASVDQIVLEYNNGLLEDIFTIASQFGSIPVIVAGDLQAHPHQYPAVSHAINFLSWSDTLTTVDDSGVRQRPLTYSRDGAFAGVGDGCSSIDAMLLNQTAFSALESLEVAELHEVQHRPSRAVFDWDTIFQHGFIFRLPAKLNVEKIPKQGTSAYDAYNTAAKDHDYCCPEMGCFESLPDRHIATRRRHLGVWSEGPGQISHLPSQAILPRSATCCLERPQGSPTDVAITSKLIRRAYRGLRELACPFQWISAQHPTLLEAHYSAQWLFQKFQVWEHNTKVVASVKSSKSYIFKHLVNRANHEPPNLVTDDDGHVLFQPKCALERINKEWDSVFWANALHEHPLQVLQVIWPYIVDDAVACKLPLISATDLFTTVQARKPAAAGGLDGWRTNGLQPLPPDAFHGVADFFNWFETSDDPCPSVLVTGKQQILDKNGDNAPLQKRLIILIPLYLPAFEPTRGPSSVICSNGSNASFHRIFMAR